MIDKSKTISFSFHEMKHVERRNLDTKFSFLKIDPDPYIKPAVPHSGHKTKSDSTVPVCQNFSSPGPF
jgi:hypothetical protein